MIQLSEKRKKEREPSLEHEAHATVIEFVLIYGGQTLMSTHKTSSLSVLCRLVFNVSPGAHKGEPAEPNRTHEFSHNRKCGLERRHGGSNRPKIGRTKFLKRS